MTKPWFALNNILINTQSGSWAVYELEMVSYPLLAEQRKRTILNDLAELAAGANGDFTIWRLAPTIHQPSPTVLMGIRLPGSDRPSISERLRFRLLATSHKVPARIRLAAHEVDRLEDVERITYAHVTQAVEARRATSTQLASLICGPGDVDPHGAGAPIALIDDTLEIEPCTTRRITSWESSTEHPRSLVVHADEATDEWVAILALGTIPDGLEFPGRAELLFSPLEHSGVRVEAAVHAEWIANARAQKSAGRSMLDAENAATEQLSTGRLQDTRLATQVDAAISYKQYLESAESPPILRATISLRITAATEHELEDAIATISAALAPVHVARPSYTQLDLWKAFSSPAAQLDGVRAQPITIEQLGAMAPIATEIAGTRSGPTIGRIPASGRAVKLDLRTASRSARPPSILCVGTLGSGKTVTSQLLAHQAIRSGSLVVDVDPKPDHRLDALPELESRSNSIDLSDTTAHAGLLDPLRIAPPDMREELAASFYADIIDATPRARAVIRTTIAQLNTEAATSQTFIAALSKRAEPEAQDVASQLSAWSQSGLARLALASRPSSDHSAQQCDLTTIRCRSLSLPSSSTPRSDYTDAERVSAAIMRLITAYALRLTLGNPSRHKVLMIDEAWLLLASSDGRALIDRVNRTGRSENITLILATQQLGDIEHVAPLIGTHMVFGLETQAEATRAAELLGMDTSQTSIDALMSQRSGRCIMRDTQGRLARVQITPPADLLAALSTTPEESS